MSPAPFESDTSHVPGRAEALTAALTRWRRELSSVGGPNTLLWYSEQRTGSLDLTTAHPSGVSMVLAGRPVRLSDLVRERAAFAEARRRAAEIREHALDLSERHGVSTGFLAVGMATWDARGSVQRPQAPVLLRSCHLRPVDATASDFDVDLGDEVEFNPVLEEYLRASAGIDLSARALAVMASVTNGFDPYPVYGALGRLCADVPGFTVTPRLVVSTFPYAKLRMVSDLAGVDERLAKHEVIARLAERAVADHPLAAAGTESGPAAVGGPQDVRADVDPDPDPDSERLVLDADDAQGDVVDVVLRGRDLVVETPPGTGATQTVANLVAALAGEGRSVLLVAQERVEIDDIHRALDSVGLGRLLLDLDDMSFDHRATAQRLADLLDDHDAHNDLDDLDANDPRGGGEISGDDGDTITDAAGSDHSATPAGPVTARLRGHRDVLRDHLSALHRTRAPWGVSVRDAQNAITVLGAREPAPASRVRMRGASLERLSRERLHQLSAQLSDAVAAGAWSDREGDDPWYGARITSQGEADRAGEIVARLAGGGYDEATATLDGILSESSLPPARTVADWGSTLATMNGVRDTLEVFRPEIFDVPLDEHVAATGSRDFRKAHDAGLGMANRARVRRQAARLLRPGRPPDDLHAELVQAQRQRQAWYDLVGAGGRPEISPQLDEAQSAYDALDADLTWLGGRLETTAAGGELHRIPVLQLRSRLRALADRPDRLAILPEVVPALDELRAAGMGEVVDDFAARGVPADEVGPELEHIWWVSIERQTAESDRGYRAHDGAMLRRTLDAFARTDREHLQANAARVRRSVEARHTEAVTAYRAEVSFLHAEAGRRDRPAPLRALVDSATEVLLASAPCWAMSPLVVGQALPHGERFDVVVVLGAGRLPTAAAVSAMSRARQVVVVGDPGGSGPRSFATGALSWSDDPRGAPASSSTSLLDEAAAVLPVRRLTWAHGRADDRLLVLSRAAGDGGGLVGAPSPHRAWPISLETVDGRADLEPGEDTTIDSTDAEVEHVVGLVLEHAGSRSAQSLGVVTVTARQAERIIALLDERSEDLHDATLQSLDADRRDGFFVVPMTALAGRTRDRIVLSVGYGRTRHGRVLYRFPELSAPGTSADLRATVTAARERLTVVSSLVAQDLRPDRLRDGAVTLREVLDIAAAPHDHASASYTSSQPASGEPLLEDLVARLRREGLVVATDYGLGPRTIDIVVADPRDETRWLVAVESDRPGYASTLGTRDRDRLWGQELRRRGWRHVRVWSTDLYRDPAREVARVVAATRGTSAPEDPSATGLPEAGVSGPAGLSQSRPVADDQPGADPSGADDERPTTTSRRVVRPGTSDAADSADGAEDTQAGRPTQTSDDTDSGWGERADETDHDRWLHEQRPPHWD